MALLNGKPMIGHVYERVSKYEDLTDTVVATCDEEIFNISIKLVVNPSLHLKNMREPLIGVERH